MVWGFIRWRRFLPRRLLAGALAATACAVLTVGAVAAPSPAWAGSVITAVPGIPSLSGVACSTATNCLAVGTSAGEGYVVPVTSGVPGAPEPVAGTAALDGIACPSPTCYAVGETTQGVGAVVPVVSGSAGSIGAVAAVPGAVLLDAIACPSATVCEGAGATVSSGYPAVVPVDSGVPGTVSAIPVSLAGPKSTTAYAVACASTTVCEAGGMDATGTGFIDPIISGSPGTAISLGAGVLEVTGLACTATQCEGVTTNNGSFVVPAAGGPVTIDNSASATYGISGLVCPSSITSCIAAGQDMVPVPRSGALFGIDNNTPSSPFDLPNTLILWGLACTDPSDCIGVGSVSSSEAVVASLSSPVVTNEPSSQSVTAGQTAQFSLSTVDLPTPDVQWQVSTNSGTHGGRVFSNILGAVGTTYLAPATTTAENGNEYRAVLTTPLGSVTTAAATLTVSAIPASITFVASPPSPATYGAAIRFTATLATSAGGGSISFADNGAPIPSCSALPVPPGANVAVSCPGPTLAVGGYAISVSFSGDATHAPVAASVSYVVDPAPVSVTVAGSQTYGGTPTFSVQGGLPAGLTLSGTPSCSSADGGTAVGPTLAAGSHTVDGSSCTGVSLGTVPGHGTAYVTNQLSGTVTPIAVPAGVPGAPIPLGLQPTRIAVTPDGTRAYVGNYGSGSVTPIDLATNAPGTPILAGASPGGIAVAPDGKTAYVTRETSNSVVPINVATGTPGTPIATGALPEGIAITPDGATAYVTDAGAGSVTPIDLATGAPGTPIPVGNSPVGIAIAPGGQRAYVANAGTHSVTPIDVATGSPLAAIPVGTNPQGIAITPDGATAYVTDWGSDTVTPINLAAGTPGTPIPVGSEPNGIAITPDGTTAYVVNQGSNSVTPIDLASGIPGTPVPVGTGPVGIAIAAPVTPSIANYSIVYSGGPFTVAPAPLTITASGGSMIYGGASPPITPSYSGFVNGQGATALTRQPTCSAAATPSSSAGSYPTLCTGATDPDYSIRYSPGALQVNPAPLTITASGATMLVGAPVPAITPSYSGFLNGDGPPALTAAPVCSAAASSSSPAGGYPTSCRGAVDPNYAISYVPGRLTVDAAFGGGTPGLPGLPAGAGSLLALLTTPSPFPPPSPGPGGPGGAGGSGGSPARPPLLPPGSGSSPGGPGSGAGPGTTGPGTGASGAGPGTAGAPGMGSRTAGAPGTGLGAPGTGPGAPGTGPGSAGAGPGSGVASASSAGPTSAARSGGSAGGAGTSSLVALGDQGLPPASARRAAGSTGSSGPRPAAGPPGTRPGANGPIQAPPSSTPSSTPASASRTPPGRAPSKLSLSLTSGPAGSELTISGAGFAGCPSVQISVGGAGSGSATPDPAGRFHLARLSVPGGTPPGAHRIVARCSGAGAATTLATFRVTASSIHRSDLVTSLIQPSQIATSAKAIGLSLLIAAALFGLAAFPSELFNSTLDENYDVILGWFKRTRRNRARGSGLLSRLVSLGLFCLGGGVLTSLLSPDAAFNRSTLALALGAAVALAVIAVLYALPLLIHIRSHYGRWGAFRVRPGAGLVAVVCVVFSRLVHFQPGYLFGLIAGLDLDQELSTDTTGRLTLFASILLLGVGVGAWVLRIPVTAAAARPGAGFWAISAEACLAAVFMLTLESCVFCLLPMRFLDGEKLTAWRRAAWAAIFAVAVVGFVHILLQPGSGYVGPTSGRVTAFSLFAFYGVFSVGFWAFFRFRKSPPPAPPAPDPDSPGPSERAREPHVLGI